MAGRFGSCRCASGTKPIGMLAASGRPIEAGTLDTLGGVVAIAIERAQFLEERKAAELTRQSEELKTALLASLGHDLRTPLTAIRVAASNLKTSALSTDDRLEQSDLILAEVERLTRLFQNILEMARIDAGAIAAESLVVASLGDHRGRARPGGTHAAPASDRGERRRRRPRAARSPSDRHGHRARAGECRSVLAGRIAHRDRHARRRQRAGGSRARPRPRHRAGRSPASLRSLLSRRRGKKSHVGHGHGTVDRARSAGGRSTDACGRRTIPDGGAEFTIVVPVMAKGPEPAGSPVL